MSTVACQNLTKPFRHTDADRELNLNIANGESMVLVGQSGCDKMAILRMIAGLERVTSGEIDRKGARGGSTTVTMAGASVQPSSA